MSKKKNLTAQIELSLSFNSKSSMKVSYEMQKLF